MKLISIAKMVLREQGGAEEEAPEEDSSNPSAEVIEMPHDNMTISVFRDKKILAFVPQFHNSITNKIRTFINSLKENFMVLRITPKSINSFEVEFDPRQNFDEVVNFIQQIASQETNK